MGLTAWRASLWLEGWLPIGTLMGELAVVVITAGLATGVYGLITAALRMEEARLVWGGMAARAAGAFRAVAGGDLRSSQGEGLR